jgi:Arc/MetJ family transcription regulator
VQPDIRTALSKGWNIGLRRRSAQAKFGVAHPGLGEVQFDPQVVCLSRRSEVNTNIDIDSDLVEQAMRLTGLRTKKKVVEAGLKALLLLNEQREIRDLRGRLHWQGDETPASPPQGKGRGGANSR